jgi:hypothetical protein
MKKKLALALCLIAISTPAAGRPSRDWWCGKAKTNISMGLTKNWEEKRDKKTGEMVTVRVPPFAEWYLVLDEEDKQKKLKTASVRVASLQKRCPVLSRPEVHRGLSQWS